MASIHKISFNISDADLTDIQAGIQTLQTKLRPILVTLSPAERKELPKMGDKTVGFVLKTQEHCKQNPDLVPQFLDVAEFNSGIKAFEQIRSFYQPLLQITDSLRDSLLLAGSESYSASLKFYNTVKHATRSKVQKAGTIYTDLATRFPGRPRKDETVAKVELKTPSN